MPELVYAVLCESSSFDVDSQRASLFNLVDSVRLSFTEDQWREITSAAAAEGRSVTLPVKVQMIMFWLREDLTQPEFIHSRLKLEGPDGEPPNLSPVTPLNLVTAPAHRQRIILDGMGYKGFGVYRFKVLVGEKPDSNDLDDWTEKGSVPLIVGLEGAFELPPSSAQDDAEKEPGQP